MSSMCHVRVICMSSTCHVTAKCATLSYPFTSLIRPALCSCKLRLAAAFILQHSAAAFCCCMVLNTTDDIQEMKRSRRLEAIRTKDYRKSKGKKKSLTFFFLFKFGSGGKTNFHCQKKKGRKGWMLFFLSLFLKKGSPIFGLMSCSQRAWFSLYFSVYVRQLDNKEDPKKCLRWTKGRAYQSFAVTVFLCSPQLQLILLSRARLPTIMCHPRITVLSTPRS